MQATRWASIPGITSAGRTSWRTRTPPGPGASSSRRWTVSRRSSAPSPRPSAPPAGMNFHAFELEHEFHMHYASDTRGTGPFLPELHGRVFSVPQIPTTLPTLDELVGVDGITVDNVAEHLLKLTAED